VGEEFGDQQLLDIAGVSRTQPAVVVVDRAFQAIDEFAAGAPQFDDIIIIVLHREQSEIATPPAAGCSKATSPRSFSGYVGRLS
jgi:hypothetical protein